MTDEGQKGPFELDRLMEMGVGPDTYVWRKGMTDWEKARDVADICRYYRQRIFNINHPAPAREESPESPQEKDEDITQFLISPRGLKESEETIDTSVAPPSMIFVSFLLTILCFPFTGIVAVYYSIRTRMAWEQASRSNAKGEGKLYTDKEREELRIIAHDYSRMAKMWAGITFFLGFILYSFLFLK